LSTLPLLTVVDLFTSGDGPDYSIRQLRHLLLADLPLYLHALLVPLLVATAAWRIQKSSNWTEICGVILSLAWLGVIPNVPIMHELLHRRGRIPRSVAFALGIMFLDPTRRLSHLHGHHVHLGLEVDTDTAFRGESIYAFCVRATIGSTKDVFQEETRRLRRQGRSPWSLENDVVYSLVWVVFVLLLLNLNFGPHATTGLGIGFALSRVLLEAFNYLQHYGLIREPGKRQALRHSWNHLTPIVRAATVEITNHAHHHMHPEVRFHALLPSVNTPQMPSALLCFFVSLFPSLWETYIAMPYLRNWDQSFATEGERKLAAKANEKAGWPNWLT
jgi:xylene monooxygenase subunit XylM